MITSRQNPNFKYIQKLIKDKSFRKAEGFFWIEGANFVNRAIEKGWEIKLILYSPEKINTDFKEKILQNSSIEKMEITSEILAAISAKDDIQGIGAIVKQKFNKNSFSNGLGIVLENISNPGNLGTIMRTMAAFKISNLYIINPSADPFDFQATRSSMSGIFNINLHIFDDIESFNLKNVFENIGLDNSSEAKNISEFDFNNLNPNTLFWLGNEAKGLSSKARTICNKLVKIPISSEIDSLNIAEAATILLYEINDQ